MEGRIKIHRKINKRWRYTDANTFRVFFHLLTIVSYWEQNWRWQKTIPWQCTVWRKYLAHELHLSEQQVRRAIINLQTTNEITVQTTNRFSLITICKWEEYQSEEIKQPTKQPTKSLEFNQQTTTTKEIQEEKKEINIDIPKFLKQTIKEFIEMRNKIKKPLTNKALNMLLNNLNKLGKNDPEKIMILEQSIFHCRQGIFPLKDEYKLDNPRIFRKYMEEWKSEYLKEMLGMEKFTELKDIYLITPK